MKDAIKKLIQTNSVIKRLTHATGGDIQEPTAQIPSFLDILSKKAENARV